jgi:hypothetical protein
VLTRPVYIQPVDLGLRSSPHCSAQGVQWAVIVVLLACDQQVLELAPQKSELQIALDDAALWRFSASRDVMHDC